MPSRCVTAAAVSVAFPDRRKAAVVSTSASVHASGGRRHRISRLAYRKHWRFTGNWRRPHLYPDTRRAPGRG
jgi:hypothetical protein